MIPNIECVEDSEIVSLDDRIRKARRLLGHSEILVEELTASINELEKRRHALEAKRKAPGVSGK